MPVTISGTTGVTTPGLASTAMPTSGGDPVVASGSNTDGDWIRWADGTQICTGDIGPFPCSTVYSLGGYYNTSASTRPYPITFSEVPRETAVAVRDDGLGVTRLTGSIVAANQATNTHGYRGIAETSGQTISFAYIATGRWK